VFTVFVDLSQICVGLFAIQTAAFFMQSPEQSDGIRFLRLCKFFRLFQRAADDFGLRNLPPSGKPLKAMRRRFVQSECSARDAIDGRPGSVLHSIDEADLEIFVSDKAAPDPRLYFRKGQSVWGFLGRMENLE